jgi:hypothetical protein
MIQRSHIRIVHLDAHEVALLEHQATLIPQDMRSRIYTDNAERLARQREYRITGMLGAYGYYKHHFGPEAMSKFLIGRWVQNQFPRRGDRGYDIPALRLDIKSSLVRYADKKLEQYVLPVRPAERKDGWVYIFALVERLIAPLRVFLVGYIEDGDMPSETQRYGAYKGAYTVPVSQLMPLQPMRWESISGSRVHAGGFDEGEMSVLSDSGGSALAVQSASPLSGICDQGGKRDEGAGSSS